MNITAADLKHSLKRLAPVRTESYQIGEHGISAQDPDIWVISESPLSGLGTFSVKNGKKLSQVVSRMSGQVEIEREEKYLKLRYSKAKIELEIQPIKPITVPYTPNMLTATNLSSFKKALAVATAVASPNKSAAFGGVVQVQS